MKINAHFKNFSTGRHRTPRTPLVLPAQDGCPALLPPRLHSQAQARSSAPASLHHSAPASDGREGPSHHRHPAALALQKFLVAGLPAPAGPHAFSPAAGPQWTSGPFPTVSTRVQRLQLPFAVDMGPAQSRDRQKLVLPASGQVQRDAIERGDHTGHTQHW